MISKLSSMGWPNIDATIGVAVNNPAASNPATGPCQRRTARYMTSTVTMPSMTCGSATDQG